MLKWLRKLFMDKGDTTKNKEKAAPAAEVAV